MDQTVLVCQGSAPQSGSAAAARLRLPTRIITYAWGDSYLDELLSLTIPALLSPGNLPYVVAQVPCEVVLLTEERLFARVGAHAAIAKLREHCPVRLVSLDDLVSSPSNSYGMALTYALHRGFCDLGPAMTDHWQIFLNADFILSDGSLRNLLGHLERGERIVAAPSYCVVASEVKSGLLERVGAGAGVLSLTPREMAKLALRHRHNTIKGKTVNQCEFHIHYMEQFYWVVDKDTLIGYQMPVAIVGMRPECYVREPNSFWDHGLMEEFCPHAEVKVMGDSDEFLMLELRDKEVAADQLRPGWPDAKDVGERMISWVTPYQRAFAGRPLTLHAAARPTNVDEERRHLDTFVAEVLSNVPKHLPSHRDHPQWLYHWSIFTRNRHEFMSQQMGTTTSHLAPPETLFDVDSYWWRLDGVRKKLATRRAELDGELQLLQEAVGEFDRELTRKRSAAVKRFHDKITPLLIEPRSRVGEAYSVVTFERIRDGEQTLPPSDTHRSSDPWIKHFDDYAKESATLQERSRIRRASLEQSLRYIESRYQNCVRALEREFAPLLKSLEDQYEHVIRRRVQSATIPIIRARHGPSSRSQTVTTVRARFNRRVYGQWPNVRKLSPYWATLRHFLPFVQRAIESGARDVLLIGEYSEITDTIVNLSGLQASVSIAGVKTGNLAKAFAEPPQFDLCICDLDYDDIAKFSEIFAAIKPYMRAGSRVVAIHVNAGGPMLRVDHAALIDDLRDVTNARLHYAGSTQSAAAVAAYRAVLANRDGLLSGRAWVELALAFPRALSSNRIEERIPDGSSADPGGCTSVTITARLPLFDTDDGTLEFSKACGAYVEGAAAPLFQDRVVSRDVVAATTTVILTFGESNATNHGQGHYVPTGPVHFFNMFDMQFYRAIDPLPGASAEGASIWGKVGDKLVAAGFRSVLFVPIAFGSTRIRDWVPGGQAHQRLMFALHRMKMAGLNPDLLCWQQGEADADDPDSRMRAAEYRRHFLCMLGELREAGVRAPIFVALSTPGKGNGHQNINRAQIRLAQKQLVAYAEGILPGPDTGTIGDEHRYDGCHYTEFGLQLAAQAWFDAINTGEEGFRAKRAEYRRAIMLGRFKWW